MSDGLLVQTMQRIMSVLDEIDERKADIKEIYAEARSQGFDKAALGVAIREIRGRDKADSPAALERASIVEVYVSAFDNAPRTYVHVPAREAAARQSPSEGEVGSAVRTGAPLSKIIPLEPLPAAQSEAAAGESPDQGSAACAAGVDVDQTAHADQFVTSSGEGEGVAPSVDPAPAADALQSPRVRKEVILRPHCLRPDMCGSYGSKHCGECERAAKHAQDDDGEIVPAFVRKTHEHTMGDRA